MPVNTTTLSGTGPDAVSQARAAWATASRDEPERAAGTR